MLQAQGLDATTQKWTDLPVQNHPHPPWPSGGLNDGGAGSASDSKNNNTAEGESYMTFLGGPTSERQDYNSWGFDSTPEISKVSITAKWESVGRPATVDNSIVEDMRHELAVTMTSTQSS